MDEIVNRVDELFAELRRRLRERGVSEDDIFIADCDHKTDVAEIAEVFEFDEERGARLMARYERNIRIALTNGQKRKHVDVQF